jgi:hypothetical protein
MPKTLGKRRRRARIINSCSTIHPSDSAVEVAVEGGTVIMGHAGEISHASILAFPVGCSCAATVWGCGSLLLIGHAKKRCILRLDLPTCCFLGSVPAKSPPLLNDLSTRKRLLPLLAVFSNETGKSIYK